jgi:tripartite-type tricarboxylate transporter receptor subunit TctC
MRRHSRRALVAALVLAGSPAVAQEAAFPSRPVTIIAAAAAGGPTDTITRIVADGMSRQLGQPVVVEAIGPANVAAQRLTQQRADGYTLMVTNIGMAASATLFRRLPYNVLESFAPLGLVSDAAMTLIARPGFPATDFAGYMAELKRQGNVLNLATAGLSSAANLCGLLLQQAAGTPATVVVFRGTAPAITELMAGRIDILCDQATNTVPFIRDGRVAAYAVTSEARLPGLEQLPTTAEAGFPSIAMTTWHGLYAPAGTPEEVQEKLSAALRGALREERLRQRFTDLVTDPATPERATVAFHRRFMAEEVARWRPILQAAGSYAD